MSRGDRRAANDRSHVRVEALAVAVENDIHAAETSHRDDRVLVAEIDAYDRGHDTEYSALRAPRFLLRPEAQTMP